MRRLLLASTVALLLLPCCMPAELFYVREVPLAPGLTFLRGGGGNSLVLVRGRRALVFDAKTWPYGEDIVRLLREEHARPLFLVNSHLHFDHAGEDDLELARGATLVASESTLAYLATDRVGEVAPPFDGAPFLPVRRRVTLDVGGEEVIVVHPGPAHTSGDVFAYFPAERALATGDIFNAGFYPHIDPFHGGTMLGVLAALDEMCRYDVTRVIPGHGPLATKADLIAYRDFLRGLRDEVVRRRTQGESDAVILRAMERPRGEPYRDLGVISSRQEVVEHLIEETRAQGGARPG